MSIEVESMGRPKGLPKTGGRQKGTPNRRNAEVTKILADLNHCPPAELARLAQRAANEDNLDLAVRANAALMPYVYAKLQSVDHKIDGEPRTLIITTGVPDAEELPKPNGQLNGAHLNGSAGYSDAELLEMVREQ